MTPEPNGAHEELAKVENLLQDLLQAVNMEVNVEASIQDRRFYFNLNGPDQDYFLGNKGDVLKHLAFLLKAYHAQLFPESSYEVKCDAGGYLLSRETRLRDMALDAAKELHQAGDFVHLEPLNSYDRRIVHLALQDQSHLSTESVGEGHLKRMVIRFAGETQDEPADA